jgi:hypothetical protein
MCGSGWWRICGGVTSPRSGSPAVLVDPMSSDTWMGFGGPRRWAQWAPSTVSLDFFIFLFY